MREMKDSGVAWIGEIPKEWDLSRIKNLFYLIGGNGFPENQQGLSNGDYPFCKVSDINGTSKFVNKAVNYVTQNMVEKNRYNIIPINSILFAKIGAALQKNHRKINTVLCCIDNNTEALVPYNTSCIGYYYYLLTAIDMNWFDNKSTIPSINNQKLMTFSIPYPSVDEQPKIASLLDKKCTQIDTLISNQQQQIEKLKAYKQSLITEVVTKGLNPDVPMKDSGVEWIGEIPEGWDLSTVLRKIHFEGGSQPALTYFIHEPKENYVRLIQNRDYRTDDYITYVPKDMVTKFCSEDDIMVGRYGPPIFVLHRGLAGAYNVAIMKAVPLGIDKEFMYYFLQNSTMISYIESFSLRAAGQSGVNPDILKKYPMCVPPLDEQKEIADYLDKKCSEIDSLIAIKQQKIEKLQQYKKSIIYEYVTGKKEVE